MFSRKITRSLAAGIAAIAVGLGAYGIVSSTSGNGASSTANAATFGPRGGGGQGRPAGGGQSNQTVVGQVPQGWHSGSGTIVTGAAANKAKAVALAKYPGGTVNRVLKLSDGSYAVHMIKINFPHHVFVSTTFKITGAIG